MVNKKILVVSESIDLNDSSASKVNVALIQNLNALGYQVRVLHYTRKEISLDTIECLSIKEIKFSLMYLMSRIQRIMSRILKVDMSHFFENIFGHSFTFFNDSKSIERGILEFYKNEDLVITLSKGASFRPHHALLSLPKLHEKWVSFVHDPYPFHYYPRPYNWVEKGYKYKEDFFREVSEKSKYSIFPSLLLKEWMSSYFPNFLKTGIVIPHQMSKQGLKDVHLDLNYFNEKNFNVLHAGNLMKQRNPKFLILGFQKFIKKIEVKSDNVKLIFLGNGSYHKNLLEKNICDTIYWSQGNVKYDIVAALQKKVSVNVILESKSEISPFLPGKFPNCIGADKPILLLGPHYSETKRLLGNDYPFISEVDDVDKISELLTKLYQEWKINKDQKLNRTDLKNYISNEYLKIKIDTIFNDD